MKIGIERRKVSRTGRTDRGDQYEIPKQNFFHLGSEDKFGQFFAVTLDEGGSFVSLRFHFPIISSIGYCQKCPIFIRTRGLGSHLASGIGQGSMDTKLRTLPIGFAVTLFSFFRFYPYNSTLIAASFICFPRLLYVVRQFYKRIVSKGI